MRNNAFIHGVLLPVRAARFLWRTPGIKTYAILPLVANILLFMAVFTVLVFLLLPKLDLASYSPAWAGAAGEWVLTGLKWLLGLALYGAGLLFGFTAVGMIVASPFNDILSEKVEEALCGTAGQERLGGSVLVRQIAGCVLLSLKTVAKQGLLMVALLPSLLIPVVGPIPLFLAGAYFQGWGFLDVPLARHFLRGEHRKAGLSDRRCEILGFGAAMTLLLLVPFGGLIVLPIGVAAGTLLYCETDWTGKLSQADLAPPPGFVAPAVQPEKRPT